MNRLRQIIRTSTRPIVPWIASLLVSVAAASAPAASSPASAAAAARVSPRQQAQDPATPSDPARARLDDRLDRIKQRLALTPEQVEAIRPILAAEGQKLQALRDRHDNGSRVSRRDRRKLARELKAIRTSTDEQLSRVLSAEQMRELKTIREEAREQLRERKGGR